MKEINVLHYVMWGPMSLISHNIFAILWHSRSTSFWFKKWTQNNPVSYIMFEKSQRQQSTTAVPAIKNLNLKTTKNMKFLGWEYHP